MKILFSSNVSWSIYNFRMALLKRLQNEGHDICVVATFDSYSHKLEQEGFSYYDISVSNNSKNPFSDLVLFFKYLKVYRKIRPDVILHNAIKPNIYGTLAAGFLGIKTINNISGLGTLFIKHSMSTAIAKQLYKISQKFASFVFFQNSEDLSLFVDQKLIAEPKCHLIPGSGVDTNALSPVVFKKIPSDSFRFLFVGRLLKDKGILEYIEAAKEILNKEENVVFNILGPLYEINETGIGKADLDNFIINDKINYLGETDNIGNELAKCDCLVLPSYREGLSKVLIEASSMAIPIVTTDVPGCRDVVKNKENGLLCEVRNAKSLENAMSDMLQMNNKERNIMGNKGREIAISKFDINIVIDRYISAINSVTKN